MACRCELYTSGTYALIRMIVTTSNPKKSLRLIRTKETSIKNYWGLFEKTKQSESKSKKQEKGN